MPQAVPGMRELESLFADIHRANPVAELNAKLSELGPPLNAPGLSAEHLPAIILKMEPMLRAHEAMG